jgi:hypothetical protein
MRKTGVILVSDNYGSLTVHGTPEEVDEFNRCVFGDVRPGDSGAPEVQHVQSEAQR